MRAAVVGVLATCVLTGCSPEREPKPSYTPVPDEKLFAEVADLPGVLGEDLEWVQEPDDGDLYGGVVFVRRKQDSCRVLDQTYAILRKGRPDAPILVRVVPGPPTDDPGPGLNSEALDPDLYLHPERRYGPQPGNGKPPDDKLCQGR